MTYKKEGWMLRISRFMGVKKPRGLTSQKPNEQMNRSNLTKKKRKCTDVAVSIRFLILLHMRGRHASNPYLISCYFLPCHVVFFKHIQYKHSCRPPLPMIALTDTKKNRWFSGNEYLYNIWLCLCALKAWQLSLFSLFPLDALFIFKH